MTINELIALANAGFTKAEIMALNTQPQPQPQPQPSPYTQLQPQNWGGGFQTNGQNFSQLTGMHVPGQGENVGKQASNVDVLTALQGLTAAVQNKNVNMTQNQIPKVEKTEDVLASIINPTYEGLGKEE